MTRPDLVRGLLNAMERAGVRPAKPLAGLLASGKLVRFRAEGDRRGRRNGWAVLRSGGWAWGHYRIGVGGSGRADERDVVSPAERARWRREQATANRAKVA